MVEWRNNLARLKSRSDYAAHAWQIIDLAIAVHPVPDLYAMRVSAAHFANRPEEVLETPRRMTFIPGSELDAIEERPNSAASGVLELRQRQIGAVNDVAERHELSAKSVDDVVTKLRKLQQRVAGQKKARP